MLSAEEYNNNVRLKKEAKLATFQGRIGSRIRMIRKERKLFQSDFESIGIPAKTICAFEQGSDVGIHRLEKIIKFFGMTPYDFFNNEIFKQARSSVL